MAPEQEPKQPEVKIGDAGIHDPIIGREVEINNPEKQGPQLSLSERMQTKEATARNEKEKADLKVQEIQSNVRAKIAKAKIEVKSSRNDAILQTAIPFNGQKRSVAFDQYKQAKDNLKEVKATGKEEIKTAKAEAKAAGKELFKAEVKSNLADDVVVQAGAKVYEMATGKQIGAEQQTEDQTEKPADQPNEPDTYNLAA